MTYFVVKQLHVTCVVLSGLGFLLRAVWAVAAPERLKGRLVRVVPHVVDTVLLASGLSLAVWSGQYPLVEPWLTAKFFGLLAYILAGTMALKRARSNGRRAAWALLAIATYAFIVNAAVTRSPWPVL